MDFSGIAARMISGGMTNIILCCFWLFIAVPFGVYLFIISVINANRQNRTGEEEKGGL
jgi:hypothetical protein